MQPTTDLTGRLNFDNIRKEADVLKISVRHFQYS